MPSSDVTAYLQRINESAKKLIDCGLDQKTEVSESNASILRQVGNRFYEQGKDQLAICKYSEAVRFSGEIGEVAAAAFANRAAALIRVNDQKNAFIDCTRALRIAESVASTSSVITPSWKEKVTRRKEQAQQHANCESQSLEDDVADELYHGKHASIAGCSAAIDCRQIPGKNRGIVAKEHIPAGSLLMVERPLAAVQSSAAVIACDYCGNYLPASVVFCTRCAHSAVRYCNEACRDTATRWHRFECCWLQNAGICTNANYRLVLRILLSHSVEQLLQHNAREVQSIGTLGSEDSDDFYASDLRSALALTGELDEVTTMRIAMCLQITIHYLTKNGYFEQSEWPEIMTLSQRQEFFADYVKALVPRVQFNCYEIGPYSQDGYDIEYDRQRQATRASGAQGEEDIDAVGMYPVQSLFNHSCLPNVKHVFNGFTSEFRAAYDIHAGEELCTEYGVTFGNESKNDRVDLLQRRYGFHCTCEACEDKDRHYVYLEERLRKDAYRCPHEPYEHVARVDNNMIRCTTSNCPYSNAKTLRYTLQEASCLESSMEHITCTKGGDGQRLKNLLTKAEEMLHPFSRRLHVLRVDVANALSQRGDANSAREVYLKAVMTARQVLPLASPTYEYFACHLVVDHLLPRSQLTDNDKQLIKDYHTLMCNTNGDKASKRLFMQRYGTSKGSVLWQQISNISC